MSNKNSFIASKKLVSEREKYSKALGKRIRALREAQNISLKGFEASENSIDRHALSRIETGQITPSAFTLYKICKAINISLADLFRNFEDDLKKS